MKQIRSIFVVQVRQVGAKLTLVCIPILTCTEDVNIQQLNFHMQFRWAVDLGQSLFVTTVRITNRADCCWENLTNVDVRVTEANLTDNDEHNPQCGATYTDNIGGGQTLSVNCVPPLLGQIVTVSITKAEGKLNFVKWRFTDISVSQVKSGSN